MKYDTRHTSHAAVEDRGRTRLVDVGIPQFSEHGKMALVRDTSKAQIALEVEGQDVDAFKVLRYRGTEGLSRLYRFEVQAACESAIDFSTIVGKPLLGSRNHNAPYLPFVWPKYHPRAIRIIAERPIQYPIAIFAANIASLCSVHILCPWGTRTNQVIKS